MSKNYITHNVYLEAADFYVLIIEFPEEDINDKLALLAPERGLIYKHFYEDFVIGTCMANTGPFFYHVRRRPELLTKFADIRKEVLSLVYKHSPGFDPQNIVVNQNNILKSKGSFLPAGEKVRLLIDNDLWDQDPPLSSFGPAVITNAPIYDGDDNPFLEDDAGQDESPPPIPSNPFSSSGPPGDGDVPYDLVGHRWDRVGVYLNVRKYEPTEESLLALLGAAPFESARGYHLLIVASCIEDYADVFHLLETLGVSKKTAPDVLMEELYNIALIYNGFLKLEDINLKDIRQKHKAQQESRQRNNKQASAAATADRMFSTGKTKKFADVPKEKLLNLAQLLAEKVVGQDEALEVVAESVQRASVGLKRPNEPLGVFMFMGNTGMGKTETAKALAEVLDAHLVRIDCQEYQQSHEPAKLIGSPPGYVGYEDGGHLTKEVSKNPFSVVLFDEIEKAHSTFHERILQIIDDGVLTDNKGKKISFSQTIIIMTSNIGVQEVEGLSHTLGFGDVSVRTETKSTKAREEALKKKFKPEFLNRIDETVHFRLLTREDYLLILDILLKEVIEQLLISRGILLTVSAPAKNFLLSQGIDKKFGARPLRRCIKKHLNSPLAKEILRDRVADGSKVQVVLGSDKSSLSFKSAARAKEEEEGQL